VSKHKVATDYRVPCVQVPVLLCAALDAKVGNVDAPALAAAWGLPSGNKGEPAFPAPSAISDENQLQQLTHQGCHIHHSQLAACTGG